MKDLFIARKERESLRKSFTSTTKNLDDQLESPIVRKEILTCRLTQLHNKMKRMDELDEKIMQLMMADKEISEKDYEEEFSVREEFRDTFDVYQSKCEFVFMNENTGEMNSVHGNSISSTNSSVKRRFKLPLLELKRFNGDIRNWIGFWGQFRKIHEDDDIVIEDKFQYLLQSMEPGSPAKALLESFPPSKADYEKAIEQLKSRFARDEFLIEVYVRELLGLVLKQATSHNTGMSLVLLYDKIETQLRALETLGVTSDKYAAMLYPLVESALPEDILRVWERYRSSIKESRNTNDNTSTLVDKTDKSINYLQILLDFLQVEVESEQRMKMARQGFAAGQHSLKGDKQKGDRIPSRQATTSESREVYPYTAAALFSAEKDTGKKISICLFCESKSHSSQDCFKARTLNLNQRKNVISKKNACFACLKSNHIIKKCKTFINCIICGKRHYPIMCEELFKYKEAEPKEKEAENKTQNALLTNNIQSTLLQTVAVKVVTSRGIKVVRALLDSASQRSYILSDFAEKNNLNKIRNEIIIQGVFGGFQ